MTELYHKSTNYRYDWNDQAIQYYFKKFIFQNKVVYCSLFMELINSISMWLYDIYCVEIYLSLQNCISVKETIDLYLRLFTMHPYYFQNDQANQYYSISLFMFPNKVVYLSLFIKLISEFIYMYDINCIETYFSLQNSNSRKQKLHVRATLLWVI